MLRFVRTLLRFHPISCAFLVCFFALLGVSCAFAEGTRLTVVAWLVLPAVLGGFANDAKSGRVYRTLPLSSSMVGTLQWLLTVVPLPLAGLIALPFVGEVNVSFADGLLRVLLAATVTSSCAFLPEIGGLWASRGDKEGLLAPFGIKQWHARMLGLAVPTALLIHPAWRVEQVDWLHVIMIATGCCLFIISFRFRQYMWDDFMTDEEEDESPSETPGEPLTFRSRRWSRILEWNAHWFGNVAGCVAVYSIAPVILYGATLFGWDLWAYKRLAGIASATISMLVLFDSLKEQGLYLRAFRMLPLTTLGLVSRFLYRQAINYAMLLIPACLFLPSMIGVSIPDVLLCAWAIFGVYLTLTGAAFVWASAWAVIIGLVIYGVAIPAILSFTLPMVSALVMLAAILTATGVCLHHAAVARSSEAYRCPPERCADA